MVISDKKFICVFCDERHIAEDAYIHAGRVGICRRCNKALDRTSLSLPYPGTAHISYIMSPFEYTDALRQAIIDFKFHNCRAYAPLFAEMMREYLSSYDIWDGFDFIVPVPLHDKRLKERGYNQSELIARHIAEQLDIPMRADLLKRTRATKQQSTLKRFDRVANVRGAFECAKDVTGRSIVLLDDICTTGNTLEACAVALHKCGAKKICALTLAIHVSEKLPVIMY